MKVTVIGAGPKAAAIAARAAAWRSVRSELTVPHIEIIEQHTVGAAWSGGHGFSDGLLELCNPGEKDIGFPYSWRDDRADEAQVGRAVARTYSWFNFLVDIGAHTEWVEKGRPFPSHARWARYIEWVLKKAGQTIVTGHVTSAAYAAEGTEPKWRVTYEHNGIVHVTETDALVLTGPGPAIEIPGGLGIDDGFADAKTFWTNDIEKRIDALSDGTIVVIGSGGAAGTILSHLAARRLGKDIGILALSPLGALFPRGDGFAERRLSSDPGRWRSLPEDVRQAILDRTDAGVVSARIKAKVEQSDRIIFEHGRATSVERHRDGGILVHYRAGNTSHKIAADLVVAALGFDSWGLLRMLGDKAADICSPPDEIAKKKRAEVSSAFGPDLCLPTVAGVGPRVHVPLLAAFAQGPGYASLGSLGATASAILDPYVTGLPGT